jgi:hypothetical protein
MTGGGRPLKFLAVLLGGWITARAVLLWPPVVATMDRMVLVERSPPPVVAMAVITLQPQSAPRVSLRVPAHGHRVAIQLPGRQTVTEKAIAVTDVPNPAHAGVGPPPREPPPGAPTGTPGNRLSRWSASAWLVVRDNGAATLAPGGTLGGSQAGLRIAYRPLRDAPVALFGRLSRPLQTPGAEAAIGIEAQPFAAIPVRAAIEQRFALEQGAAEGTAVSLVGGVSDVRLPAGLLLDGYGQAGVIGWRRRAAFADGAVSISRPVASLGRTDLLLGGGVWGAAQPGVSRLDVGPRAELRFPVGSQRVRLSAEWRQRIAGNARPRSGPALTLGTDF